MDKDRQIQKVEKLSLKKLSEDSSLAKRGLRDLGIWPKIQTLLREIEEQYFADRYQECIDLCDEVLASESLHFPHLYYRAYSLIRLERYTEALVWLDKVLKTEPDFGITLSNKGFCLLQLKKYDEALIWLGRALKITPENYIRLNKKYKDFQILKGSKNNVLQNKAFCLEKLGRIDEARS